MKNIIIIILFGIHLYGCQLSDHSFTDSSDGKTYKTVKIGDQVWMAENLNYDAGDGSWCYKDSLSNCDKYGRLYDWETAKRAAPKGWHLPNKEEFETLLKYSGGEGAESYKQILPGGLSGFNVLFGGWRGDDDHFYRVGKNASFWSSSPHGEEHAWGLAVDGDYPGANLGGNSRAAAVSIRLLRD
jgi:uncharacterized protein (TIGR02145 family)